MSALYSRLHRIFTSIPRTTKPKTLTKPPPQSPATHPRTTKPNTLTKLPPQSPATHPTIDDLLQEKNPEKLVHKFKLLTEDSKFRSRHHRLYKSTIHRLFLAQQFFLIEDALETQKKYISDENFAARLIRLYGDSGMCGHARNLFDELPQRNCDRTAMSFRSLLGAYLHSKKFVEVYQLFKDLPPKLSIEPDLICHNIVVHALCEMGSLEEAMAMVNEMEGNGLTPNVVTFNTLLGAFYRQRGLEDGNRIWMRMAEVGVEPNLVSYRSKVGQMVKEEKPSQAAELVEGLKGRLKSDLLMYLKSFQ
ncbi:hypothetical protein Dimus_035153 [Dionaea muscipula]